jgi:hypothetical protein
MIKRKKSKRTAKSQSRRRSNRTRRTGRNRQLHQKRAKRRISDSQLERGLRVVSKTHDLAEAARAIRVPTERFKNAASRRKAIRESGGRWLVVGRFLRRMPIFSGGQQLAITTRSRSASLIGRYMSAVGQFLSTNDASALAEFEGRGVKDSHGNVYKFETDPNVLYKLSSAGGEPFEDVYKIVI